MEDIIDIIVTETTNLIEITSQASDETIDVNIIDNREDITLNVTPTVVEININSLTGSFGVNWGEIQGTLSDQTDLNTALGLKADLVDGKVPSSQLPSYVDDIIEVANYAALPATGETGKIYVVLDTNKIYRWSGSAYIEIADSTAVWGAITGTLSSQTDLQSALDAKLSVTTAASTYVPYTGATGAVNLGAYDLKVNDLTIGKGTSGLSNNTALGHDALFHITTGNYNTGLGHEALHNTTTGEYNTAFGQSSLFTNTTGGQNTAIGLNALLSNTTGGSNTALGLDSLQHNTTGSSNVALGYNAGSHITGGSTPNTTSGTSIYIGRDTRANANGGANEIVIGHATTGNGSNTVTIGNSSITANYLQGSVNAGSFVKSGGTSSQFLKADGSVDSNSYALTSQLHNAVTIGTANGLSLSTQVLSLGLSSSSANGALSSTDWTTFNGKQAALSGSGIVKSTEGTISYLTDNSANWNAAYNDKINSAEVTGTSTKTLTLTQQDGGTVTASWTDINTDAVSSVFGRTGAVVAASGDYTSAQITEDTNLYFTNARARSSVSAGTGISYNSTTGVITNTITQYTDALARAAISLTTIGTSGASGYDSGTGVLNVPTYTLAGLGGVPTTRTLTINGTELDLSANRSWTIDSYTLPTASTTVLGGVKVDGTTITINGSGVISGASTYTLPTATDSVLGGVKIGAGVTITSGVISVSTNYQAPLGGTGFVKSTAGTISYDTSTYLTTTDAAANYQAKLTNPVTGSLTTGYIPKATGTTTLGNSLMFENSNNLIFNPDNLDYKYIIVNQATSADGGFLYTRQGVNKWQQSMISSDADALSFYSYANTSVSLQLRGNGNVLIGTQTDGGYKLDVNGYGRFSNQLLLGNFNGEALKFQSSTSTGSTYQRFYNSAGTARGYLGLFWNGSADYMVLDAGATQMNFGSSNSFTFTGGGAATFSSSINATTASFTHSSGDTVTLSKGSGPSIQFAKTDATAQTWALAGEGAAFKLYNYTASTTPFQISTTGAATFLSNIAASSFGGNTYPYNSIFGNGTDASYSNLYAGSTSGYVSAVTVNGGGTGTPNTIIFTTASAERMQITSGGTIIARNGGQFRIERGGNYRVNSNADGLIGYLIRSGSWKGTSEDNLSLATDGPYGISFFTNGSASERVLITSGGNVLMGTATDAGGRLQVDGGSIRFNWSNPAASNYIWINRNSTQDGGLLFARDNSLDWQVNNTGGNFTFYSYGISGNAFTLTRSSGAANFSSSVTATSFFESSDKTIKTLIEDNYQNKGIESVVAKLYIKNGKEELGYFAQDVQGILPSAVSKGSGGLLSLSYREVHTAKIARLEKELEELKARLN